jgi:hypothetical protein
MWLKGVEVRRSNTYGWRWPEPGDVDDDGRDLIENDYKHYFVLVRLKDCPDTVDKHGRVCYEPKGVKQAVKLRYGGTYYGYGKHRKKMGWVHKATGKGYTDGYGVPDGCERGIIGYTVPFYAVKDGYVYTGTIQHYDVIYCPKCGEAGRERWFQKFPKRNFSDPKRRSEWWDRNHRKKVCTNKKCGHEWTQREPKEDED